MINHDFIDAATGVTKNVTQKAFKAHELYILITSAVAESAGLLLMPILCILYIIRNAFEKQREKLNF